VPPPISQIYNYDNLNRLTNVSTDSGTPQYKCSYQYDDVGRIQKKVEGSSDLSGYDYYTKTSRLKKAKLTSTGKDYLYSATGNLVVDKLKKMTICYDYRNLPIKYSFYDTIPAAIDANSKGDCKITNADASEYVNSLEKYMDEQVVAGTVHLLSSVVMLYDADGNRVLKIEN